MLQNTRERLGREAKRLAAANARRRVLRLKGQFPHLTDRELAAIESDCQLSYIAGFSRAINDPLNQYRIWR